MGGRVVYGNGLENRRVERHRGFESLPIRQFFCVCLIGLLKVLHVGAFFGNYYPLVLPIGGEITLMQTHYMQQ